jgi:hypothetical protein
MNGPSLRRTLSNIYEKLFKVALVSWRSGLVVGVITPVMAPNQRGVFRAGVVV